MKTVTYLMASPDEVANVLTDEKLRCFWDPNVIAAVRQPGMNED